MMTTTQKLKAYWYFVPLFILIVFFVALANYKYCNQHAGNYTQKKRQIDSAQIILDQDQYFFSLKKEHDAVITSFIKIDNKDTTAHHALKKIVQAEGKRIEEQLMKKNKQLITQNASLYDLKQKLEEPINVWLLLSIVLICGTLGGIARTYYPDLEELEPIVKQHEKTKAKKRAVEQAEMAQPMVAAELDAQLTMLDTTIQQIKNKNTPGRIMFTNLMFGLIASLLSFVAMELFRSSVLDFTRLLDYFILAGWCTVGAVFAKKWLFAIHSKITA